MGTYRYLTYTSWASPNDVPIDTEFTFFDHLNGFDKDFKNPVLDLLQQKFQNVDVIWHNVLHEKVYQNYSNLNFKFSADLQENFNFSYYEVADLLTKKPSKFKNFTCSFNGSCHYSRMLLTSALHKFGWFSTWSTKNFKINENLLDGFIMSTCGEQERFYRKFIVTDQDFYNSIHSLDYNDVNRYDHIGNVVKFEAALKNSFVHIVSETLATSYQSFVTEKILYSIITKGLWLAYAAPGYHFHVEKYYGFRKFSIFDYAFDEIANPVVRLVALLTSLSKFEKLSINEWHDLYLMEKDTIDFNFDHYMSKSYLKVMKKYE